MIGEPIAAPDVQSVRWKVGSPSRMAGPCGPSRENFTGWLPPALMVVTPEPLVGGLNPPKSQITSISAVSVELWPCSSVIWTVTVTVCGAWRLPAENVTETPGVSNEPLPSRSQA